MALIQYLTRIQFEIGAVSLLSSELELLGGIAPLVITDKGIVAAGILKAALSGSNLPAGVCVFSDTPENPTEEATREAVRLFRENQCDSIIAIGGGSPIDLAKGVSLLATHPEPLERYAAVVGGAGLITADKPPVIAVPTTAGTGSEVGRAALLTLEDGRKLGFISPHMIPNVAICDPELTFDLPPHLTAATGMDAVTHCIETFMSPRFNPVADAIAIDGLARAMRALRRLACNPGDVEARIDMMMAALQGGLTFQKGLGAVHSLSHPLGGLKGTRLHHGTLNAVLLPAVLRFNSAADAGKVSMVAEAMELSSDADLATAIAAFVESLGLPGTLSAMGVPYDALDQVAAAALLDHSTATNPRNTTTTDFRRMLEESWA